MRRALFAVLIFAFSSGGAGSGLRLMPTQEHLAPASFRDFPEIHLLENATERYAFTDEGGRDLGYLGHGNSATVLKARDKHKNKPVALKLFTVPDDFFLELRCALRFRHPNIIRALDYGTIDFAGRTHYFYTMEVAESTLGTYLYKHGASMGEDEKLSLFLEILNGAEELHRLGVIWGDIKQRNILLFRDGGRLRPVIADLANAFVDGEDMLGQLFGDAVSMTPESLVFRVRAAEPRLDVYSLGAVLFQLLSDGYGSPFASTRSSEIFVRPVVPRKKGEIPDGLWKIIERAMAPSPLRRYASVAQFRRALDAYRDGRNPEAIPEKEFSSPLKRALHHHGTGAVDVAGNLARAFSRPELSGKERTEAARFLLTLPSTPFLRRPEILRALGSEIVLREAAETLRNAGGDPLAKQRALLLIAASGHPESLDRLFSHYRDRNNLWWLREIAVAAMGYLDPDPAVIDHLADIHETEDDFLIRHSAENAIARLIKKWEKPGFEETAARVLRGPYPAWIKKKAINALDYADTSHALELVQERAGDAGETPEVKSYAGEALYYFEARRKHRGDNPPGSPPSASFREGFSWFLVTFHELLLKSAHPGKEEVAAVTAPIAEEVYRIRAMADKREISWDEMDRRHRELAGRTLPAFLKIAPHPASIETLVRFYFDAGDTEIRPDALSVLFHLQSREGFLQILKHPKGEEGHHLIPLFIFFLKHSHPCAAPMARFLATEVASNSQTDLGNRLFAIRILGRDGAEEEETTLPALSRLMRESDPDISFCAEQAFLQILSRTQNPLIKRDFYRWYSSPKNGPAAPEAETLVFSEEFEAWI